MFSRFTQWSLMLVVGVLLAVPARAATLQPITVAPTFYVLALDTQYLGFEAHAGATSLGGTDTFLFKYAPPPFFTATNSTTNLTIGTSGFSVLSLNWLGPVGSGVNQVYNAIAGLTNKPLSLTTSGLYQLIVTWALPNAAANGTYSTSVLTPERGSQNNPLPLPPALLLFGSALVGLTALGRRKRKGAAV